MLQTCLQVLVLDNADEAISFPWQGFYETWVLNGILQGVAQTVHGLVQAHIEIDKRIGRPELFLQLLASD